MNSNRLMRNVLLCGLLIGPLAAAQSDRGYLLVDINPDDILLQGNGYDSARLSAYTEPCIDWGHKTRSTDDFGKGKISNVTMVKDSSDVSVALGVSYRSTMKALTTKGSVSVDLDAHVGKQDDKVTWVLKVVEVQLPKIIEPTAVTMLPNLPKDPIAFRRKCGDYYVAGFVVASRYRAALEINKGALSTEVSATYVTTGEVNAALASGSTSTEVRAKMAAVFNTENMEITQEVDGGGYMPNPTDIPSLLANYAAFPKESKPIPIKYILAPYPLEDVQILTARQATMEDNARLWYEYHELLQNVRLAERIPGAFLPFKPGTAVRWQDTDYLEQLQDRIEAQQDMTSEKISGCEANPESCQRVRKEIAIAERPEAYGKLLPDYTGWISSCAGLAVASPLMGDGEYTLYYKNRQANSYTAICKNMHSSPSTSFKFYFVGAPDPSKGDLGANFAQIATTADKPVATTVYSSIMIDPETMRAMLKDKTGVTNGGTTDYGHAQECDMDKGDLAQARIDLRGTKFKVDTRKSASVFSAYAYRGGPTELGMQGINLLYGDQVVTLSSPPGGCSWATTNALVLMPK